MQLLQDHETWFYDASFAIVPACWVVLLLHPLLFVWRLSYYWGDLLMKCFCTTNWGKWWSYWSVTRWWFGSSIVCVSRLRLMEGFPSDFFKCLLFLNVFALHCCNLLLSSDVLCLFLMIVSVLLKSHGISETQKFDTLVFMYCQWMMNDHVYIV